MELLISLLSGVLIIYGFILFFSPGKGSFIAALVCISAGVFAYDTRSFIPLAVGVLLLFALRGFGFEKR